MKRFSLVFALTSLIFFTASAQNLELKGTLKNMPGVRMVKMSYDIGDERITDSALVINGSFLFNIKLYEVSSALMIASFNPKPGEKGYRKDIKSFYIEPGKMLLEGSDSLKFSVITGSKAQKAHEEYLQLVENYSKKEVAMLLQYLAYMKDGDIENAKRIGKEKQTISEEKAEKITWPYIINNPNSPIALNLLINYAGYDIRANKIEPVFKTFPKTVQNSPSGIAFKEKIEVAKKSGIGVMALPFTQNDTIGKPVSLTAFKGKYVLLDFWASWCAPCRHENPYVVQAFDKYKDKNFTVVSISLDGPGKHKEWMDAIHKDGLIWTHLSDLKLKDNAVAVLYGISAIPQNFLIDPSGVIIAKNLRKEELGKKLEELLQ